MATEILRILLMLLLFFGGSMNSVKTPEAARREKPVVPSPGAVEAGVLQEALELSPAAATMMGFTDWEQFKHQFGADAVTSESPFEERFLLLRDRRLQYGFASKFTLNYLPQQAEAWGWDTTDLRWEATITGDAPPVYVLQLRDDFDMQGLIDRFEEHGFARTDKAGAILFAHEFDPAVDWVTELAVFSAAILPDRNILIHAFSPEPIMTILDAIANPASTWHANPNYQTVSSALGQPVSAIIASGAQFCVPIDPAGLLGTSTTEAAEAIKTQLAAREGLLPFIAAGVGYNFANGLTVGRFVFHYLDADAAQADLPTRSILAKDGMSTLVDKPYSEIGFTLEDATVEGNNILLNVRPVNDESFRLFTMVDRRDMTFAACP